MSYFLIKVLVVIVCAAYLVPPHKGWSVVPFEVKMVEVMHSGTSVPRQQIEGTDGNIVSAVHISGFSHPHRHPDPQEGQMVTPKSKRNEETYSSEDGFKRMGILGLNGERSSE